MRFSKIYLEISNLCNLSCSFCPGTRREKRTMTEEEFTSLMPVLRPWSDFLYFHLMGEPLCHPDAENFLEIAGNFGFRVILTTNGTLLNKKGADLLRHPGLHKVNISLQAAEANDFSFPDYLEQVCAFGKAAEGNILISYRLWNNGGLDSRNAEILDALHTVFPGEWVRERRGIRIGNRVYLEHGDKFDWPELTASDGGETGFCYGLRDQIGVLCDGTVVPCCLDHDGDLALGNLFRQSMEEILDSPRAKAIYDGFSQRKAVEPLCRRCGYARRFQ